MSCSGTDTAGGTNLSTIRGDSFGFKVRIWQDADKTIPADLSQATVTGQLRVTPDAPEVEATYHTDIVGNEVTFSLLPTETAVLPQMTVWDIEVDWFSDGTSVQTITHGMLSVGPDVTRVV